MARMRAPENTPSCSFAGVNFPVDEDGFVDVPDAAVVVLKDFGFELESEIPAPIEEAELTPKQKAAAAKAAAVAAAAAAKAAETPAA